MNNLADLISRMLDENGNELPSVREEFEVDNAQLEPPYRILTPEEWNPRITHFVEWMGGLQHAFSALEKIPLQSDLIEAPAKRLRGGSVNEKQSRKKKKESGSAFVKFTNPDITTFWEPELTDRREVDRVKRVTSYTHDAFTSVTRGNSSDTIIWSEEMEDQQKKFKRKPKGREGLGKSFSANSKEKREVGNAAAAKEALRNAEDEHICATLHDCEVNCEKRHSTSCQGEEETHVHVQCEHGFVLISGIRDNTLQPVRSKVKCKAEGERWLRSQRLLPEPSTAPFFEKVKGDIDVACARVPKMSQETVQQLDEQWKQAVGAASSPALSARQMLEEERESFTITNAMEYLQDDSPAFSSAYVGVGAGIGAIGSFETKKFKPKWSAEINPIQQEMWNILTAVMCLGNFFELDPAFLPWVYLLVITLPCTDFSTGGSQRGDQGDTG